jgi:predicted GH43/DUF377 family glycosyl hydrolase
MSWKKLGLVFCPSGEEDWLHSHAAAPIAETLSGSNCRIYFNSRDASNRSHVGYVVIDLSHPQKIIERSTAPVLAPGGRGLFDDSGAMASWLVKTETRDLLYYVGWSLGVTVPFRNFIGLARRESNGNFNRHSLAPILGRSRSEPFLCIMPCVLRSGRNWRMWYGSGVGWTQNGDQVQHRYHIKQMESVDGLAWRNSSIAIDFADESEYAITRPSVMRDADRWRMWYCSRGSQYAIGYATSADGVHWQRRDSEVGIAVSEGGWDSEMVCYPYVFDHGERRYMLYNGNGYGRTGFGLAVLESDDRSACPAFGEA